MRGGTLTRAGIALALLAALIAGHARAASAADVYFLQGEQAVAVSRPGDDADATVRALLSGPTAAEKAKAIRTQVPAGVPLRSVTVANGVATVDLGEKFVNGTRTDSLSARLAQLVLTVNHVPGVKKVKVLVKGGVPLGLFPGVDLTKPVTIESLSTPQTPPPVVPTSPTEPPTTSTRDIQQKLADLGYLDPTAVDGRDGPATSNAVMAFQKWEGLQRDGDPGPQTVAALAKAQRPTPRTSGPAGSRVEVLLDRQLTLFIVDNKVQRVLHVSSGKAGYDTPPGQYTIQRKYTRDWSVPYEVWLPWASYFIGGYAFHEYADVPPYPASHGCVRVPPGDMKWLYDRIQVGTPVTVLGTSR